jgi:hypothetical protein
MNIFNSEAFYSLAKFFPYAIDVNFKVIKMIHKSFETVYAHQIKYKIKIYE